MSQGAVQMSEAEAKHFEGFSLANATLLTQAAAERGCSCAPYEDWFTYDRWRAQGMQVQKGQHGVPRQYAGVGQSRKRPSDGRSGPRELMTLKGDLWQG